MTNRLRSAFFALVLLIMLSACATEGPSSKALEEGVIPLDQFHSEDGNFQYAQLPIGITREEAAKRLGVEELGELVSKLGDVSNYLLANRVAYGDQEVAVLLEFQGDGLTLVQFNFLSHDAETLTPIKEELTEQLYELYGIYSLNQVESSPYHGEISNWDTHLDGDVTRLSLHFSHGEQQEDGSVVANLSLSVGKMVFANETE